MSNTNLYTITNTQLMELNKWKTIYIPDWKSGIEIRLEKEFKNLKYNIK